MAADPDQMPPRGQTIPGRVRKPRTKGRLPCRASAAIMVTVLNWGATTNTQIPAASDRQLGATHEEQTLGNNAEMNRDTAAGESGAPGMDAAQLGTDARYWSRQRYMKLLGQVQDLLHPDGEPGEKERLKIPPPEVSRPGTKASCVANFQQSCEKLGRLAEHVAAFVQAELGTTSSLDAEQRLRVNYMTQKKMEQLTRKYVREYVACTACSSLQTKLLSDSNRLTFLQCAACGSERRVQPIQRGFVALGRGERRRVRAGAAAPRTASVMGATAGVEMAASEGEVEEASSAVVQEKPDSSDDSSGDAAARASKAAAMAVDACQATLNIGCIGHVAHGKSSLVRQLTGVKTQKHKDELERNITIRLGYANAKLFECETPGCPEELRYAWRPSSFKHMRLTQHDWTYHLVRHVSFVDCPGHEALMQNMISGAAVMDAAILLVAANEPCPAAQTMEHLSAVSCLGLEHIVTIQNKVDLVSAAEAEEHFEAVETFIEGTAAAARGVTPICAQLGHNLGAVCALIAALPRPDRRVGAPAHMHLVRSFDVNRPGTDVHALRGGVAGGALTCGVLTIGDEVELRPGILGRTPNGEVTCTPLRTRVESLFSEGTALQQAFPGGLIGVGTALDAWLAKEDRLKGLVLGQVGTLPPIFCEITVKTSLMRRAARNEIAGTEEKAKAKAATTAAMERRPQMADPDPKAEKAERLRSDEELLISVGASSCAGRVRAAKSGRARIELDTPICAALGDTVALSRRRDGKWRLIGRADILAGCEVAPLPPVVDVAPDVAEAGVEAQCPVETVAGQAAALNAQAPTKARVDAKVPFRETVSRTAVGSRTQPETAAVRFQEDGSASDDACSQHTHERITCRMRERLLPEVNEVVAVHVERIVDSEGVYVTLLEYGGAEAMIALSEISRKRKGQRALSVTKATRVGTRDVCVVMRVDEDKGYVDLSKWRVTDEERASCDLSFKQSKAVQSIVRRVAETQGVPSVELYEQGVWPLSRPAALDCHAHEAFVLATTRPDAVFNARFTPELPPHLKSALLHEICLRLRPSSTKLKAQLMVRCLGRAGCSAVRSALMEGVAVGQRHGLDVSIKADVTPLYTLRATCAAQDKEAHIKTLATVVEAVEQRVSKHAGGELVTKDAPHATDERDGKISCLSDAVQDALVLESDRREAR